MARRCSPPGVWCLVRVACFATFAFAAGHAPDAQGPSQYRVALHTDTVIAGGTVRLSVSEFSCEGSVPAYVQLMAAVANEALHSQFTRQFPCGGNHDWELPAPPSPGQFTLRVVVLFHRYTHDLLVHDRTSESKTEDARYWTALINQANVRMSGEQGLEAHLTVRSSGKDDGAGSSERRLGRQRATGGGGRNPFARVEGYWAANASAFHSPLSGMPSLTTSSTSSYKFVGDSVLRMLFLSACVDLTGRRPSSLKSSEPKDALGLPKRACAKCCWAEGAACLHRQWWADECDRQGVDALPPGDDGFCDPPTPPRVLYVSFGSHAPNLGNSARNLERYVRLLNAAKATHRVDRLVLASTTAINENLFPHRYSWQFFMRSNARIMSMNALAEQACSTVSGCTFLDLFTPTFALRDLKKAYVLGDPIHPKRGLHSLATLILQAMRFAEESDVPQPPLGPAL